jgi:hypothetical protein
MVLLPTTPADTDTRAHMPLPHLQSEEELKAEIAQAEVMQLMQEAMAKSKAEEDAKKARQAAGEPEPVEPAEGAEAPQQAEPAAAAAEVEAVPSTTGEEPATPASLEKAKAAADKRAAGEAVEGTGVVMKAQKDINLGQDLDLRDRCGPLLWSPLRCAVHVLGSSCMLPRCPDRLRSACPGRATLGPLLLHRPFLRHPCPPRPFLPCRQDIYRNFLLYCMTGDVVQGPMGVQLVTQRDEADFARLAQLGDVLGLGQGELMTVHQDLSEQAFTNQASRAGPRRRSRRGVAGDTCACVRACVCVDGCGGTATVEPAMPALERERKGPCRSQVRPGAPCSPLSPPSLPFFRSSHRSSR